MEIFGFEIKKAKDTTEDKLVSFVSATNDDGALEIASGTASGQFIDLEGAAKSEADLVTRYRTMALTPQFDSAIEDVCNEAIVIDDEKPVDINLENLKQPKIVKDKIREEFQTILKLLDFNNLGYDIFKQWYVDGRLYYHLMIDEKKPRLGIKELRKIDPRKIKKVREKKFAIDPRTRLKVEVGYNEFYMYFPKGTGKQSGSIVDQSQQAYKIAKDSICYVTSGIMDVNNKLILSHLHKAIKPFNQLRMLEDATVIYRLARAPERRIFYIDVGNLPKAKAEQYLYDMMTKHKNKLVYDGATGEIKDDRKFMTMLEDFWLPRREGKNTEITTLPGGQNLGEMDDVNYFKRELYRALNVPITRIEAENQFNLGRASEITRDELKFNKFITRLRNRFSILFDQLLEIQLILKGVLNKNQWKKIRNDIYFEFAHDNHFTELKELEILRERIGLAAEMDAFAGKYYSALYVRKNAFRFTDEEMEAEDKQMKKEREDPEHPMNIMPQQSGDEPAAGGNPFDSGGPGDSSGGGQSPAVALPGPEQDEEQETSKKKLTKEEKELVESMTKFMHSITEEERLEDWDE
jgi:hypothetical protein